MKITPEMHTEVIDFINSTTSEQHLFFLKCLAEKISINLHTLNNGVKCWDIEEPFSQINFNGLMIDINLYEEIL